MPWSVLELCIVFLIRDITKSEHWKHSPLLDSLEDLEVLIMFLIRSPRVSIGSTGPSIVDSLEVEVLKTTAQVMLTLQLPSHL